MKGKRLVATMLALLLVVSLLPMTAMASTKNSHERIEADETYDYNEATNVTNYGTVTNNCADPHTSPAPAETPSIQYNNGTVVNNGGSNDYDKGTVVNNNQGGTVQNNYDTVKNNNDGATVENNNAGATVENNYGLVGQKDENGNLITNGSSGNFGTVENNKEGGVVAYNRGEVGTNEAGGVVAYNSGMVEKNESGGIVQYNDGGVEHNFGTVENNSGNVVNAGGTVVVNNPGGYVYGGDRESVTTNYGTHQVMGSEESPGTTNFYGVHFVNDKDEMVYLGDYENGTDVKLEQLQKNCTGYKIYGIEAVAAYNRGENKFEEGTAGTTGLTSFNISAPTRLQLLWERIISVVKPAASSGGGEVVSASYNPNYIGLGSVIFINEKGYKVVEIKDDAYVVVTFDALPDEDVADLDALYANLFTPEQQKQIKNLGQLLDAEDVLTIFGKPGNHPVFEISKTLAE